MSHPQRPDQLRGRSAPASSKKDLRPTPDQMYLASRLNGEAAFTEDEVPAGHRITPAALQKWNLVYGVERTTGALRAAWGFPPLEGIGNAYAYVAQILRGDT